MKHSKFLLALSVLLCSISIGEAHAESSGKMEYVDQWDGPFEQTVILKWADPSDGVVCYLYSPKTLATNSVNFKQRFDGNNTGSISCVKVKEAKNNQKSTSNK